MRIRSVFIPLLLLACFAVAPGLEAASCGGAQPCQCGDTVTSNYLLGGDLGPCSGHGLVVKSNVVLDCRGFQITGLGGTSEQYGISLSGKPGAEISGATVKGCRVSRFHRGIRLRAASSNPIADNTASDNGDQRTRTSATGSTSPAYRTITCSRTIACTAMPTRAFTSARGATRIGSSGNTSADNYRENLYLLLANGNVFVRNTLGPGGVNSLYLKDSGGNLFEGNTFRGNTARIVGDARDNQFVDNTFSGAGLHFQPYKGTARSPSNNRVTGGAITGPAGMHSLHERPRQRRGRSDLGGCRTAVRSESPSGPSNNTLIGALSAAAHPRRGRRSTVGDG